MISTDRSYTQLEQELEQNSQLLYRIAKGDLLARYSSMTKFFTCDTCRAEGPMLSTLPHKDWCLVIATRRQFPKGDFSQGENPPTLERRRYLDEDNPRFAWWSEKVPETRVPLPALLERLRVLPSPYTPGSVYEVAQEREAIREALASYACDIEWDDSLERYVLFTQTEWMDR